MSTAPQSRSPLDIPGRAPVADSTGEPDVRTAPRLPAWARTLLAMAAMMAAALSGLLLTVIPGVASLSRSAGLWAGLGILAGYCLFTLATYVLLTWLLATRVDRRPFRTVGVALTPRAGVGLAIGLALSLVVVLATALLVPAIGGGRPVQSELGGVPVIAVVVKTLLLAFVLQGIGEELIFRGYLLSSLSGRPVVAIIVSGLAFGVLHLVSDGGQQSVAERFVYLAIPTGFGLLAGVIATALRSVWPAVGIHAGFHVATAVTAALGIETSGPVAWVVAGSLYAVIALGIGLTISRARWAEVSSNGTYGR